MFEKKILHNIIRDLDKVPLTGHGEMNHEHAEGSAHPSSVKIEIMAAGKPGAPDSPGEELDEGPMDGALDAMPGDDDAMMKHVLGSKHKGKDHHFGK
jgi:hypothetical protein